MTRVCTNGHNVVEDYLKSCPKCGAHLPPAMGSPPPLAAATLAVRAPRGLPMLLGGVILGLFGTLLSYAAHHGPAEAMGNLMLGLGGVLVLVGAVALGVKLGIEDSRRE